MNEKGSTTLFGVFVLLMITSWGLLLLKSRLTKYDQLQDKMHVTLCSKRLNGKLGEYVGTMEKYNTTLALLTTGKALGLLIPVLGTVTAQTSTYYGIKIVKGIQLYETAEFMIFLGKQLQKGCIGWNLSRYIPYTKKRDLLNRLKFRKKQMKYSVKGKKWKINTNLTLNTQKFLSKMKKVRFSLNL